jgi:hypothetical protein
MPELLPLRHGRVVHSAFTFHRGAALRGELNPLAGAFDLAPIR